MSTSSIECYYSPNVVEVPVSALTQFLTASTTASSTIGNTLKTNISIANLIAYINTRSELDKRWSSDNVISTSWWNTFYDRAGAIDYDFTTTAPKAGDELQFVFRFDATVTGGLNGIVPSSTPATGVSRFLVGQTFRLTA